MSAGDKFTTGLIIKDPSTGAVQLGQITRIAEERNPLRIRHGHGGNLSPMHASFGGYAPAIIAEGTGLKMYLDVFGLTSFDLGTSAQDVNVYMQEYLLGGSRKSTSDKLAISRGMAFLTGINGPQEGIASASLTLLAASSDGTTDPIVRTAAQTMPAESFTQQVFGGGKVTLNSIDITGLISWSLDMGNRPDVRKADGDVYITHVSLAEHAPTLTLNIEDVKTFITSFGKSGRMTTAVFYCRERALGGTWTADATASHIKFTAYEGIYDLDSQEATHNADGSGRVEIQFVDDRSTGILTVNTASAIS